MEGIGYYFAFGSYLVCGWRLLSVTWNEHIPIINYLSCLRWETLTAFVQKREEMLSTIERAKMGSNMSRRSNTFGNSRPSPVDVAGNGAGRYVANRHGKLKYCNLES